MHTLLDTCLKEIEIHEYLARVLKGLDDEEEVKKLCYLMLVKLAQIAPIAVTQRKLLVASYLSLAELYLVSLGLDDSVDSFKTPLDTVLKDNAVKQETERLAELQKAALRCMAVLNRLASPGKSNFDDFIVLSLSWPRSSRSYHP